MRGKTLYNAWEDDIVVDDGGDDVDGVDGDDDEGRRRS